MTSTSSTSRSVLFQRSQSSTNSRGLKRHHSIGSSSMQRSWSHLETSNLTHPNGRLQRHSSDESYTSNTCNYRQDDYDTNSDHEYEDEDDDNHHSNNVPCRRTTSINDMDCSKYHKEQDDSRFPLTWKSLQRKFQRCKRKIQIRQQSTNTTCSSLPISVAVSVSCAICTPAVCTCASNSAAGMCACTESFNPTNNTTCTSSSTNPKQYSSSSKTNKRRILVLGFCVLFGSGGLFVFSSLLQSVAASASAEAVKLRGGGGGDKNKNSNSRLGIRGTPTTGMDGKDNHPKAQNQKENQNQPPIRTADTAEQPQHQQAQQAQPPPNAQLRSSKASLRRTIASKLIRGGATTAERLEDPFSPAAASLHWLVDTLANIQIQIQQQQQRQPSEEEPLLTDHDIITEFALGTLYHATHTMGSQWVHGEDSWMQHGSGASTAQQIHFCDWYGITCAHRKQKVSHHHPRKQKLNGEDKNDKNDKNDNSVVIMVQVVTHIMLSQNNLQGEIPPELLAGLRNDLLILDLSHNLLYGKLPDSHLFVGGTLQQLRLEHNALTGKAYPPKVAAKLKELTLFHNSFEAAVVVEEHQVEADKDADADADADKDADKNDGRNASADADTDGDTDTDTDGDATDKTVTDETGTDTDTTTEDTAI